MLETLLRIGLLRFARNDGFGTADLLKELKGHNLDNATNMSENPVVIVSGASRGAGAAAARWLALQGPPEFSGQFLDYDDPRISSPALALFGEKSE